jgi:transcription elongation factor Elf1
MHLSDESPAGASFIPCKIRGPLPFCHHSGERLGYHCGALSPGGCIMNLANNLAMLRCQSCGGIMKLVRSVPKPEGHSVLLFFTCPSCGEADVKEEKSAA